MIQGLFIGIKPLGGRELALMYVEAGVYKLNVTLQSRDQIVISLIQGSPLKYSCSKLLNVDLIKSLDLMSGYRKYGVR